MDAPRLVTKIPRRRLLRCATVLAIAGTTALAAVGAGRWTLSGSLPIIGDEPHS